MRNDKKKCKETTLNGNPCEGYPGEDGYCFSHSPNRQVEATEARSKGGTTAAIIKSARKLAPDLAPLKLDGPGDVIDMLRSVATDVYNTKPTARFNVGGKARALAAVATVLLKAYELTETDDRLATLEATLSREPGHPTYSPDLHQPHPRG
ncbi:MAG: hypothetical protein ABUJ98_10600 [Hyphomicrobium sp.]